MMKASHAASKIIFALDVSTSEEVNRWSAMLASKVGMFKVGKQLFTAVGPSVVSRIINDGGKVFLDLKYHDIPNTVSMAVVEAAKLGVSIVNLHALGGYEMMARSVEALRKQDPDEKTKLIAVTVLTSSNEETLREIGINSSVEETVVRLALLAKRAGIDGVVASPVETAKIREACGLGFLIVTPGVRPSFSSNDDQKRIMTPAEAVSAGSDYLVIGRPISAASEPLDAVNRIAVEMSLKMF